MGCDIHLYIEKQNRKTKKWIPAQGFINRSINETDPDNLPDVPINDRFNDRNYMLFGALAGVRESQFQMFKRKGFPKDASKEVKAQHSRWGSDAHSASYITLKELQDAKWDQFKAPLVKMFRSDHLSAFRKTEASGKPDYSILNTWCSMTTGDGWGESVVDMPIIEHLGHFKDLMYWLNSYDYSCKPEEIRIVFWFDN